MEGIFQRVLVELQPDVVLITHLLHHSPGYVRLPTAGASQWSSSCTTSLPSARGYTYSGARESSVRGRRGVWPAPRIALGSRLRRSCAGRCGPSSFRRRGRPADVVLAPSRFLADALPRHTRPRALRSSVVENAVAAMGPVLTWPRGTRAGPVADRVDWGNDQAQGLSRSRRGTENRPSSALSVHGARLTLMPLSSDIRLAAGGDAGMWMFGFWWTSRRRRLPVLLLTSTWSSFRLPGRRDLLDRQLGRRLPAMCQ